MATGADADRLAALVRRLRRADAFDHPVERFEILETHISYVLLTGPYAYKLKKPVDLGFLDFTTLARRARYCREELRLNRRLAPGLYVGVVAVTGTRARPVMGGQGAVLEYAVKMVQFPAAARLDRVLAGGGLTRAHIDDLATQISDFHRRTAPADPGARFGSVAEIRRQTEDNFDQITGPPRLAGADQIEALRGWSETTLAALEPAFATRKRDRRIRDCHGDMHLSNIALVGERPVIFDCIEFSEDLRWNDVISEVAFLVMDLDYRERAALARRFLNAYLERGGDYAGVAVLRHYLVYRTLVRAKIAHIRMGQSGLARRERDDARARFDRHVALARCYTEAPAKPPLVITHGLSGSGKSTLTERLVEVIGAIRVRSDLERRRRYGLEGTARSGSGPGTRLYRPERRAATYDRLLRVAGMILRGGYPAIVDATFLERAPRARFRALARALGSPFHILDLTAGDETLARRVARRARRGGDPSEATLEVLAYQRRQRERLSDEEVRCAMTIDTAGEVDVPRIAARLAAGAPGPRTPSTVGPP